jgi:hypothetical protein
MGVVLDYMCMLHTQITPEVAVTTDCSKNQHVSLSTTESSSLNKHCKIQSSFSGYRFSQRPGVHYGEV